MNSSSLAKGWFFLSLLVLAFGYGFVSHAWGLFPKPYLEKAWQQAYWRVSQVEEESGPSTFTGTPVYNNRAGANPVRPGEMQSGLTLISSSWEGPGGWEPELRLIDRAGEVLHRWRLNRKESFQGTTQKKSPSKAGVHGSYLLPGGDVVINLEYVGMVRLDPCGDVVWKRIEGNHHSISRAEDGTFWVPAVSEDKRSRSDRYDDGFPGLENRNLWLDRILRVTKDGEVIRDIPVMDIIYQNDLERYIPKVLGGAWPSSKDILSDITHLNDVEPLDRSIADAYPLFEAGDLVVSLRSLSLVFVFDPETLEVKWHSSEPFVYQHDPDFIGDGWIGVFDNNYDLQDGEMLGGSRIVGVQPHTDSTKILFEGGELNRFYTSVQGKWQQLRNGNMLLSETTTGRAVEVDTRGRLVWEWIQTPVDRSTVPSVTKATRTDLTRKEVASWACSSVDSVSTSVQKQQTAP